jgi:putative membrane protein
MNTPPLTSSFFPALNASLNGLAALLLLWGFVLIKKGRREAHEKVMTAAFAVSATFLACYLWYHFHYASNRFGGVGLVRGLYFTMLISHILLATAMVPFILRLLWLGYRGSFSAHARLGRRVWPVWMYTSVTGVLVYFMLYHWFPGVPVLPTEVLR